VPPVGPGAARRGPLPLPVLLLGPHGPLAPLHRAHGPAAALTTLGLLTLGPAAPAGGRPGGAPLHLGEEKEREKEKEDEEEEKEKEKEKEKEMKKEKEKEPFAFRSGSSVPWGHPDGPRHPPPG
jgi:hypothetical protein